MTQSTIIGGRERIEPWSATAWERERKQNSRGSEEGGDGTKGFRQKMGALFWGTRQKKNAEKIKGSRIRDMKRKEMPSEKVKLTLS